MSIGSLPPLVAPAGELGVDEVRRYSRHVILPDVAMVGQRRLKNAKVLVIGAGGLGSPTLAYLAAAGVGTLGIVDFDTVEESNLQRQVVHGESDVGRLKVDSAQDAIAGINPHVQVVRHPERLDSSNATRILRPYDLVVDGTDNFPTRYLVNDACVLLGKPYVWGSIFRFDGQASVFWAGPPADGPCYRCLHPEPPPPGTVPSCAEGGVLGVLCGSIGSVQATEAIKLITGIGQPLVGRVLGYDALDARWREFTLRKDRSCAVCGDSPSIRELIDYDAFCGSMPQDSQPGEVAAAEAVSVTELARLLGERERGETDFLLVDVREPHEHDIVRIPGSVLIPKAGIDDGSALSTLPRDRRLVLHCKSGGRSAQALSVLRHAGFDAVHVDGGVLAWAREIDQSLPTY